MTPLTTTQQNIVDAYHAYKKGAALEDKQVKDAASQQMDGLLTFIKALGPEFHFMWKDLMFFHEDMKRFHQARKDYKRMGL